MELCRNNKSGLNYLFEVVFLSSSYRLTSHRPYGESSPTTGRLCEKHTQIIGFRRDKCRCGGCPVGFPGHLATCCRRRRIHTEPRHRNVSVCNRIWFCDARVNTSPNVTKCTPALLPTARKELLDDEVPSHPRFTWFDSAVSGHCAAWYNDWLVFLELVLMSGIFGWSIIRIRILGWLIHKKNLMV